MRQINTRELARSLKLEQKLFAKIDGDIDIFVPCTIKTLRNIGEETLRIGVDFFEWLHENNGFTMKYNGINIYLHNLDYLLGDSTGRYFMYRENNEELKQRDFAHFESALNLFLPSVEQLEFNF